MTLAVKEHLPTPHTHAWLKKVKLAYVPGPTSPLLDEVLGSLLDYFRQNGHQVQAKPQQGVDVILTTAPFGEPLGWRDALLFTGRRRLSLDHTPTFYTFIHVTPAKFQQMLDYFEKALAKESPNPQDFEFPGLAPQAHQILVEQGRRGGPMMALERLLQAQAKSIRIVLIVGDDIPRHAYHFDLVGAYPRTDAADRDFFYTDIMLRIVTSVSTGEVTEHKVTGERIPRVVWNSLATPAAMTVAGRELGQRSFFTAMVRIADLVHVPSIADAVASQYSEGCFATWEPKISALIATVTGSARPVDKDKITEDDVAVIVGVRPDGRGALVRHVADKQNDPPSSEAVEMMDMDAALPKITLGAAWGEAASAIVPVVRSKLHGHRGVAAYDPRYVEFVPLDEPYYHYPVSCATEAQAHGIKAAFARSASLRNPGDSRQMAFTVLPGHGVVMVEKWVPGKVPFQVMWEYMDAGYIAVENRLPQGVLEYVPVAGDSQRRVLSARQ